MNLEIPDVSGGVLSASARVVDGAISARFAGTADSQSRAQLDGFVKQLHVEALRFAVPTVTLDLRELEFMNSSSVKILVAWIAQLRDLDKAKQYRVKIRSDPNLLWQRRSLAALSCFAVDLVTIET
jgi:hypothetical protein